MYEGQLGDERQLTKEMLECGQHGRMWSPRLNVVNTIECGQHAGGWYPRLVDPVARQTARHTFIGKLFGFRGNPLSGRDSSTRDCKDLLFYNPFFFLGAKVSSGEATMRSSRNFSQDGVLGQTSFSASSSSPPPSPPSLSSPSPSTCFTAHLVSGFGFRVSGLGFRVSTLGPTI